MHECSLGWHRMIHVPYNETLHSWTWSWLFYSFTCSAPSAAFHGNLRGKNIRHSAIRISLSFPTSLNLSCLTASMPAQMPSQLPSGQHWHPSKIQAKWVTETQRSTSSPACPHLSLAQCTTRQLRFAMARPHGGVAFGRMQTSFITQWTLGVDHFKFKSITAT